MFGEIAKTFGRGFLVAWFVPASVFLAANLAMWLVGQGRPLLPFMLGLGSAKGVALLAGAFLLALGLSILQSPIVKAFEGYHEAFFRNMAVILALLAIATYLWFPVYGPAARPVTFEATKVWIIPAGLAAISLLLWIGHPLGKSWQRYRFRQARLRTDNESRHEFSRHFPHDDGNVLPTRVGNSIRAFESHATVYNIDPITSWYRLVAVIPKEYQSQIGDAEANFYAVLNLSAVAYISAAEIVSIWVLWNDVRWLVAGLAVFVAAFAIYRFACAYAR